MSGDKATKKKSTTRSPVKTRGISKKSSDGVAATDDNRKKKKTSDALKPAPKQPTAEDPAKLDEDLDPSLADVQLSTLEGKSSSEDESEDDDDDGKVSDEDDGSDDDSSEEESEEPMKSASKPYIAPPTSKKSQSSGSTSTKMSSTSKKSSPASKSSAKKTSSKAKQSSTASTTTTSAFNMRKWLTKEMRLDPAMHSFLLDEGICTPEDLCDIDDESLKTLYHTCAKLGSPIPILCQNRLRIARKGVLVFSRCIGRQIDEKSMSWKCLASFAEEWKSIEKRSKEEIAAFPKLTRDQDPHKYIEAVQLWCSNTFGQGKVSLMYLLREDASPGSPPPLARGCCHSDEYDSLEEEMIDFAPHLGVRYREDNKFLATKIEKSIHSTSYFATVKQLLKKGKGKEAWDSLTTHLATKTYHEDRIDTARDFIQKRTWSADSKQTLQAYVAQFQMHCETLADCNAQGHACSVPDEREKVRLFLNSIQLRGNTATTSILAAAISTVRQDQKGELSNFKLASEHLLNSMPSSKARSKSGDRDRGPSAQVSGVTDSAQKSKKSGKKNKEKSESQPAYHAGQIKSGVGKTGVHLRYHTTEEFKALSAAQKEELVEWLSKRRKQNNNLLRRNKKLVAKVAALEAATATPASTSPKFTEADVTAAVASAVAKLLDGKPPSRKKAKISSTAAVPSAEEESVADDEEDSSDASSSEEEEESSSDEEESDSELNAAAEQAMKKLVPTAPGLRKRKSPSSETQKRSKKRRATQSNMILRASIANASAVDNYGKVDKAESTTQLDSHANWWVLSDDCTVFNEYKKKISVAGFSTEVGTLPEVPIVDAALAYHCPYSDKVYILIVSKALWVPSMAHNLACPFIMREAGIEVNEKAKQHCESPTVEEHSIYDPSTELRIPLQLDGIFSCFPTRALTKEEYRNIQWYIDRGRVVHLCPKVPNWDPNDSYYADRETSYLDCDGNIVEELLQPRPKLNLVESAEIASLYSKLPVLSVDAKDDLIDAACDTFPEVSSVNDSRMDTLCRLGDDPIAAIIASVDPLLNEEEFKQRISDVQLETSVGLTAGCMSLSTFDDDDFIFTKIGHALDIAAATISAVTTGKADGVSAEALSKCWRISYADAARTLQTTTQLIQHDVNGTLSRNFGTSDRALRYRRIQSIFFMDTLIIGKNAHSVRGYKYVQVFASDKGFVYIYLMTSLTEIPIAVKNFTKEVGIPDTLVADAHPNQKDKKVRSYCLEIGTKLRILEESTQWANFSERIIGLLKEVTRKDIRETDAPIIFWCYAMERRVAIMNLTSKSDFKLRGANPYLATFGQTGDISNICHFTFFDWCYYRDNTEGYPNMRENLGRCLGPTRNEGNEMAQWILTKKGTVIVRRTLRKLTPHELSPTKCGDAQAPTIHAGHPISIW
eukprot:scaffold318_cov96-Skeletonema_dohrnii-CCMP3373.AAC.6